MDIDGLKRRNEARAQEDYERGPAVPSQEHAPVGDALAEYWATEREAYAIPAHKGVRSVRPDAAAWAGDSAFRSDIAMTHGVDDRHASLQIQATAQRLFAEAVGAEQCLFSTNGSSMSVHVALLGAAGPGEEVVMTRAHHKSAFAGLVLSGARPVWVEPVYDERWQVAHGVLAEDVERTLDAHPGARAVFICTPTYYGVTSDVRSIAELAHARDLPLLCDDAWGLDHSFCSRLPASALECGADLAIGSVHKTLSAFSQTSVISLQGERVDRDKLQLCLELQSSTSSSALLVGSIDGARRQFVRDGERLLGGAIDLALELRERISAINGLELMSEEDVLGQPGNIGFDPTHVSFDVIGLGLTGWEAADWLRRQHNLEIELSDHRRLMPLITWADTPVSIDRLVRALQDLAEAHADRDPAQVPRLAGPRELRSEQAMIPREAFFAAAEHVPWRQAQGRISAELITPYPPGVPLVAPGERYTAENIEYLEQLVALGGFVEGAIDPTLDTLRVVA